jgi:glycine/D-amino acid oxidase-like deaminating enzyme
MNKKVAIVGAGLAGLAVCWHLCQVPNMDISLFDRKGIGGGASGVSTGLMHPFVGRRAIRSWRADEGMEATCELIAISENALGRCVSERSGIFRPAITLQQRADFMKCANSHSDTVWKEDSDYGPGLWIPNGMTLYSSLYLQGLWRSCASRGARLIQESVSSLEEIRSYDAIVLATGFETLHFAPHLPLDATKGQTLLCRWPKRLPFSLVSQGHITPTEDPSICQVGSTYEHNYSSLEPDRGAIETLLVQAAAFYPPARDFEVVEVRAGVRISRPKAYRPILEKLDPKTWVFTGLGSRGMLYHALLGKQIAQEISI